MTDQKQDDANTAEDSKAYHAPKLEDYGEVGTLTQTSPVGGMFDGGPTYPNNYTSFI